MGSGGSWFAKLMLYFGIIIAIVFIGLGIVLVFTNTFNYWGDKNMRIVLGLFLMMYGLFRFVKVYQNFRNPEI
jgi:ACR3 family arsenite efflux pump ArsB